MNPLVMNYFILCTAVIVNSLGCLYILKKNVYRYGLIFIISLVITACLCILFYWLDFYRFVLPIPVVLPVVAISFSFLALLTIRFRPMKKTFPFFFITLTMIFSIEVFLKDFCGFIQFKNGWDYWDSYSLYWVFARLFDHIGEYFVPFKYRAPIKSDTRIYWVTFFLMVLLVCIGLFLLSDGCLLS